MMKGLILINPYSDLPEILYQPKRLQEEFKKKGVEVDIRRNDFLMSKIVDGNIKNDVDGYDFCIYLDKDRYNLKMLCDSSDIPVFNSYDAIMDCNDKMMTYIRLADSGLKMPKTVPGILCHVPELEPSKQFLDDVESYFGYPFIIKECYGSMGEQVYLVHNREEFEKTFEKVKCTQYLFQEFIDTSMGRDVRVIVIGGKVIGAIERISNNDFRSNVALGGSAVEYPVDDTIRSISEKVAKILNLEYCGLDLMHDGKGGYYICEVNSNAFFGGFEKATGMNVAKLYVEYILDKLGRN